MTIIPAIDILEGKVARLRSGVFEDATFFEQSPLDLARRLADAGIQRLHLVDLSGARQGFFCIPNIVADIKQHTSLVIDVGGGIRTDAHIDALVATGADIINVGSVAIESPKLLDSWFDRYGADKFIVALDVRDGVVQTRGWTHNSGVNVHEAMSALNLAGAGSFMVTDISRDGNSTGISRELYHSIRERQPHVYLIASGGVSGTTDFVCEDVDAIVVGIAWLSGEVTIGEMVDASW
ncbi:MAG: HisA/HisF-related TIM barrel protein [bacterium]|nr:HisA/HisF-related TIM barrel protein [bacterium]